jgi:hypothetical protein
VTAEAPLSLPSGQQFGEHPGQIPALIHEAYLAAAEPAMKAHLAAALARAWAYGGDAPRGIPFADQAVSLAERAGDPGILADALDGALLSRWGPDDFTERLRLSVRLADTVGRDGATAALPNVKGLHYIRYLLRRPGEDVRAVDLAAAVAGHPGVTVSQNDTEVIDAQALSAYRARLADIDAELSEAESWADGSRASQLRFERDALLDEIGTATGLCGRRRQFSSAQERARIAVRKAVVAALDRIEQQDSSLARQLRDSVRTGGTCRYDPDPARPVIWILND